VQEQTSAGDTCVGSPPTALILHPRRASSHPHESASQQIDLKPPPYIISFRFSRPQWRVTRHRGRKRKADPCLRQAGLTAGSAADDEFAEAGGYATHFMVSFLRFLAQSRR